MPRLFLDDPRRTLGQRSSIGPAKPCQTCRCCIRARLTALVCVLSAQAKPLLIRAELKKQKYRQLVDESANFTSEDGQ